MAFDLTSFLQLLNGVSATAVVIGVIFVVFQLRQNARLIEASNRQIETSNRQVEANIQQNKQQVILSTIDRFTSESFNLRRRKIREIVKKHQSSDWNEFLESEDDYLIRGFLSLFETTAYLVKIEIADVKTVSEGMGPLVMSDWTAVKPAVEYYRKIWKRDDAYLNFELLERSIRKYMEERRVAN